MPTANQLTLRKPALFPDLDIFKIFFILAICTISFDLIAVIEAGFNFRIAQIFLIIPFLGALLKVFLKGKAIIPLGFPYLIIWAFFILLFTPNTEFLERNIGYDFWLIFNIFLIFSSVQLFDNFEKIRNILRWYLISFVLVSVFGLIQFTLPLLGLGAPLVIQWWIPGRLPRLNGFSYEPSYFATYLMLGWCFSAYLVKKGSKLFKKRNLKFAFLLISITLFLSSSRMGWLLMIIWILQYPIGFFVKFLKGRFHKLSFKYSVIIISAVILPILAFVIVIGLDNIIFLFNGLGIMEGSGGSSTPRIDRLIETLTVFTSSPIIGSGLGGIAPAIGNLNGVYVNDFYMAKLYEGMSIFAETLAASGIFGIIPFIIYFSKLIFAPFKLANLLKNKELKFWLVGMTVALIFELLILQFNQNILRLYLWLHIAILSALYHVAKKELFFEKGSAENCY